ncbi:ESX-1 secretion-associated protein [Mycolicibacterium pulveris]|uniref:ESX-1 secretion-associated protein n=1 Tax=Mycolicibacterium pulveris TaxID=36813 RepID=UPI003CE66F51
MSHPDEPLKVDPTELRMAADQLAGHASGFQAAHRSAQERAGRAALGSGSAAAALPAMVAAWDADGARFGEHFARYVQAHREAADGYVSTDAASADEIDDAGSAP